MSLVIESLGAREQEKNGRKTQTYTGANCVLSAQSETTVKSSAFLKLMHSTDGKEFHMVVMHIPYTIFLRILCNWYE